MEKNPMILRFTCTVFKYLINPCYLKHDISRNWHLKDCSISRQPGLQRIPPSPSSLLVALLSLSPFDEQSMLLPNLHQPILRLRGLGGLKETIQALLNSPTPSSLDSSVYSSVLQLCIDMNARREGRLLHDHLSSIGYRSDLRLDNKLLIFYGKVGVVDNARQVFDGMFRRTVVSWTAMISAYSQNGLPEEAVEAFVLMRRSGCYPNQFTFGSVLKACTGIGCVRIGSQIHGCALKSGFMDDRFVQAALVDLNAKCGSIEDARFIFDDMEARDLVSWNAMIGGCAVHGCGQESFELFHHMRRKGVCFDQFTFSSLLKACGRIRASGIVDQIHTLVIQLGLTNDSVVTGTLIDAYAKCRNMSSAKVTYESMKDKDLVSFTALVTGYSQQKGCSFDALELFRKKNHMGFQMDRIILCSMLNVCADTASASLGRQMHACAVKNQPKSDLAMANALVDMYAKTGEIEDARLVFDEMQFKNVISWTSMINGYGKHGNGEDAIMLFEKMEHQGLKPNDITFLSLLFACSHTGLTNKGWKFFNTMVCKYNIHPRAEHYSCIVDLLARGGQLEEAYDFLCSMDIKFNTSLWRTLLGACNMHTNLPLGKIAANCLVGMDPHSSANYVVLANLYAATGLWEDAWKMRKLMEEKHIKKEAAWSSLQFTKRKPLLLESS